MRMRPAVVVWAVLIVGALVAPATAAAARSTGSREALPYFDSRESAAAAAKPRTSRGRASLRSSLGRSGVLKVDPLTNTPRTLLKLNGALTRPSAGSRDGIARSYLRGNASALGLSTADVDALTVAKRENAPGGLTMLRYRQAYQGIPTFDNGVRVAIDRAGRVLGVNGSPQHGLSVASVTPRISAADALRSLERSVGLPRDVRVKSGPSGARRTTGFANGEQAQLTLFGAAAGPRLAWRVDYKATSREHYDAIVDASNGRLLWRANRVKNFTANVFDYYLGAPDGGTLRDQDLTTPGWLPDTATNLTGPNVHTWSDINDDDLAQSSEEVTPEGGDFNFDFTPFAVNGAPRCLPTHICGWDPVGDRSSWDTNRKQSATEAFFMVNKFHDHLAGAPIGFDTASGNFQGDDPLLQQSFDGADTDGEGGPDSNHSDNANMDTPPDGQSPTMQLYLFEYFDSLPQFDYLGDDAATIWHEYTHGLSNRLIVDESGVGALNSPHAGAMGEAWSDWYAEDLLLREGLETDDPGVSGDIDLGEPSDAAPHVTRSEAIDCPVGPSLPADACPGGAATDEGGYTLGDFGKVAGVPEVHSDGEIWVQTLWDLRNALVDDLGSDAAGSDAAEALVTTGMRLSPPEPSMLDERNAILQADTALNAGAQHSLIWSVFAHRGMGFFASVFDGGDTHPAENFDAPPADGTPTGSLRGTISDSQTGLPIAGVVVRIGAATTSSGDGTLTDTTAADGTYSIGGITEGTYGKLAVRSSGGYEPVDVPDVEVSGGEVTTKDVALVRNWASKAGGASVVSANDDLNGPDCDPDALIDDQDLFGWAASNPTSPNYPGGLSGDDPTATFALPKPVDISAIGIDPAPGCDFLAGSAALKGYRLEVSSDGTAFRPFKQGEFAPEDGGTVNHLAATGTAGKNVKQVRLTLLSSQDQCDGCTGRDFIGVQSLEVFGVAAPPPPSGSPIPTVPTPSGGTPPPGGGATPIARPRITIARSGKKGSFTVSVTCAERCKLSGKLTVSRKVARKLHRSRLTLSTVKRTITTTARKTIHVKLSRSVLKALKKGHLKSVKVKARFTASYSDGRRKTVTRTVKIKR